MVKIKFHEVKKQKRPPSQGKFPQNDGLFL